MSSRGMWNEGLSVGRLAELACLLEVSASKPGNVHRGADFEDVTFQDFAVSAVAIGQAIDMTDELSFGETVLEVATRTHSMTSTNTNLGMNLLISLLAKAARKNRVLDRDAVEDSLARLDSSDASRVYEAIRLMSPGGLGQVDEKDVQDVQEVAPQCLLSAMKDAEDRDRIAAQFTNDFIDVFQKSLPWIVEGRRRFESLMQGIVWAHVKLMAEYPDSLIGRKCGLLEAEKSQAMAQLAIDALVDGPDSFFTGVANLDFWLRSNGHKRNPGTTADLIAAGLFVGLCNGQILPPFST